MTRRPRNFITTPWHWGCTKILRARDPNCGINILRLEVEKLYSSVFDNWNYRTKPLAPAFMHPLLLDFWHTCTTRPSTYPGWEAERNPTCWTTRYYLCMSPLTLSKAQAIKVQILHGPETALLQTFRRWKALKYEAKLIANNRMYSNSGVWWKKALTFIEQKNPDDFLESLRFVSIYC